MAWDNKDRARFAEVMKLSKQRKAKRRSWVCKVYHEYDVLGVKYTQCLRREGGTMGRLADMILDIACIDDVIAVDIDFKPDGTFAFNCPKNDRVIFNTYPKRKR